MKKIATVILAAVALSVTAVTWAHSGGTNSQGCHYDHKTGDYHCH